MSIQIRISTTISRADLGRLIQSYNGSHFFSVEFIKKTTGENRKMTCRKGVVSYTTGAGLKYDPIEKGLVPVWDAQIPEGGANAYRMISLSGLLGASIDGVDYVVDGE